MKNRCKLFGVQTYKVPINIFQLLEIGMYFSLSLCVIMKNQISFNSQVGKMPNMDHKDDQNDSLVSISSLDFFFLWEFFLGIHSIFDIFLMHNKVAPWGERDTEGGLLGILQGANLYATTFFSGSVHKYQTTSEMTYH